MQLSKRLQAVAALVSHGNTVADVGCDHAYTSIYLVDKGISPSVIAMDVNKGPLKTATANIAAYKKSEYIETRLSDGLKKLIPGETDTILITGMGGLLTIRILSASPEVTKAAKELVLQPQSEIGEVRRYLHSIGFEITEENILKDEGKFYVMIKSVPAASGSGEAGVLHYDKDIYYDYGKLLLESRSPVLKEYMEHELSLREMVLAGLQDKSSDKSKERVRELTLEIDEIKEGLLWLK